MQVQFTVNGRAASVDVPPNTLLVHALREHLQLTGTHVGCDTSQCGACTVHVNGRAVKSCAMLAVQAQGAEVTTIEGMAAPDGTMHPMQAAFKECHGLQCGFCTPGMVMSATELVQRVPDPSEHEIRHWLELFHRRFFTNQFKRSTLPNGPKVVAGGSLSPRGDWRMPSDAAATAWLAELERNVPRV